MRQFDATRSTSEVYERATAWIVRDLDHQLVLGRTITAEPHHAPICRRFTAPGPVQECSSIYGPTDAELLASGAIVIGGHGKYYGADRRWERGGYALRYPWGAERKLVGDPGIFGAEVEVEPGTNTAWALTLSTPAEQPCSDTTMSRPGVEIEPCRSRPPGTWPDRNDRNEPVTCWPWPSLATSSSAAPSTEAAVATLLRSSSERATIQVEPGHVWA